MKTFMLMFLFAITLNPGAKAGNIGPFDVDLAFCEDAQQLASLTNAWQTVQYPVAGMPGIVFGINQNTNQVLEYCKYLIQMEQLTQSRSMNTTINVLNKMTDSRWAEEMSFIQNTWDVANSNYNFKNPRNRKASLNGARINSSLKKMVKSYSAVKKKYDPVEDANMVQLAEAAQKRAVLSEMISCPKPENPDKDYGKVYETEIQPLEEAVELGESNASFYQGRLLAIGMMMLDPYTYKDFEKEVYSLIPNALPYNIETKPENVDTVVKTGEKTGDGNAETKTETIQRNVQSVTVNENSKIVREFRDKWSPIWLAYIQKRQASIESTSSGRSQDLARMNFENDMRRTIFDCPPSLVDEESNHKYRKSKILKEPLANQAFRENMNKCVSNTRVNVGAASQSFDQFIRKYTSHSSDYRRAQAQYWSLQSKYLGVNVSINNTKPEGVMREEVQCSDKLSMADMQTLSNEMQQVNLSQNEIIAQSSMKSAKIEEAKAERDRQWLAEQARKQNISTRAYKGKATDIFKASQPN